MSKISVIEPFQVVIPTEISGPYIGAKCLLCSSLGWMHNRLGYPHGYENPKKSKLLLHTEECPLTNYLEEHDADLEALLI